MAQAIGYICATLVALAFLEAMGGPVSDIIRAFHKPPLFGCPHCAKEEAEQLAKHDKAAGQD